MSIDTSRRMRQPITAEQRNDLKKLIVRCLADDFHYGKPNRKKFNHGIYDRVTARACYNRIDLDFIMDKIALALSFGMDTGDDNE